jgi:hypothetical protein
MGGVFVHQENINWSITVWLSLGSVPAALDFMDFKQHKTD